MEKKDAERPIGIFDSGIGGLTVAHQLATLLPQEELIYFGDTAHLPYGDKSAAAIQAYSIKICNLLLSQHIKAILIACNSASAAAFDLVKEYVGSKALVFNVIDPAVDYVVQKYEGRVVGLIGTKQTIHSGIYEKKIHALNRNIEVKALATPLLAPMIEEGFFNHKISQDLIEEYLQMPQIQGIDALILACTHYPLIAPQIKQYYQGKVDVIDTSLMVAQHVKNSLAQSALCRQNQPATHRFFVSDYTKSFENSTQIFFQDQVSLEHYPLWD